MTSEEIASLNLGIELNTQTEIIINSGIEWLNENTTIDTADSENFPSIAKLFLIKFNELQSVSVGVSSESIEGLSQSFDNTDKTQLLWQIADELLQPYLKNRIRFVCAKRKWN